VCPNKINQNKKKKNILINKDKLKGIHLKNPLILLIISLLKLIKMQIQKSNKKNKQILEAETRHLLQINTKNKESTVILIIIINKVKALKRKIKIGMKINIIIIIIIIIILTIIIVVIITIILTKIENL
jgi:hypothetical protein